MAEKGWWGMFESAAFQDFPSVDVLEFEWCMEVCSMHQYFPCNLCEHVAKSSPGLGGHMWRIHGLRHLTNSHCVANCCPMCDRTFANIASTRRHLRTAFDAQECPSASGGSSTSGWHILVPPKLPIACPLCGSPKRFNIVEAYHLHYERHHPLW